VAILALDPTSPYSGGALLGDRIRMGDHYADPGVFIRSMATRGHLGGLSAAASDVALLLDAASFDAVLIETVGVGQDEVEVARVADVTAVVLVPGMGDDVQALKAGIMEIADVYVINKADYDGVERLEQEIDFMLNLAHRWDGWRPPVIRATASEGRGIAEVLAALRQYLQRERDNSRTFENWKVRLREMHRERLLNRITSEELTEAAQAVASRRKDPYTIVDEWLKRSRD
jgi:LAO/AO transport system kinase